MGRYDFRPLRVHQTATQLLNTERITKTPAWYNVVGSITPAQTLVRTQPLPHQHRKGRLRTKKSSKLFQPQTIRYEEDALRKEFFKDHPWELARPRLVIENDGKDSQRTDWSRIEQPHKALSGERWVLPAGRSDSVLNVTALFNDSYGCSIMTQKSHPLKPTTKHGKNSTIYGFKKTWSEG